MASGDIKKIGVRLRQVLPAASQLNLVSWVPDVSILCCDWGGGMMPYDGGESLRGGVFRYLYEDFR